MLKDLLGQNMYHIKKWEKGWWKLLKDIAPKNLGNKKIKYLNVEKTSETGKWIQKWEDIQK